MTFQGNIEIGLHAVTKYMFNKYQMHWEGKLKLRSHNISYCLIEVVTSAGLPKLDLYSAVLFHGYNSPQVDMSLYYYTLY